MGAAGDRQELGEALDDPEDDGLSGRSSTGAHLADVRTGVPPCDPVGVAGYVCAMQQRRVGAPASGSPGSASAR